MRRKLRYPSATHSALTCAPSRSKLRSRPKLKNLDIDHIMRAM